MAAEGTLTVWAAQRLAAAGVAVWQPDGAYPAGTGLPVITVVAQPDKPDALITLTAYPLGDDADTRESTTGLQVRARTGGRDPRTVQALCERVWDELVALTPTHFPDGVHIHDVVRASGAMLDQDPAGRWERVDTYRARVHVPAATATGRWAA